MPDFTFEAVTKDNVVESGQIAAASAAAALTELESRGLTVHSLQQVEREGPKSDASPRLLQPIHQLAKRPNALLDPRLVFLMDHSVLPRRPISHMLRICLRSQPLLLHGMGRRLPGSVEDHLHRLRKSPGRKLFQFQRDRGL